MVEVVERADTVPAYRYCLKAVWGFGVFFPPLVMRSLLLLGLPMGPSFLSLQGVCAAQPVYFDWT